MRNLFIFTFCLAGVCVNCITVTGYEGGGAFVRCNYPQGYETNKKYFCRVSRYSCNDLIKTEKKNTCFKNDKFSLYDNTAERYFTVWINNLQQEDSGEYQCGIDINYRRDVYTEIQLEVKKGQRCGEFRTVIRKVGNTFRITCDYSHRPDGCESRDKYVCKGESLSSCKVLIWSEQHNSWDKKDRFDIKDNTKARAFSMWINDVKLTDSGTYWCGTDQELRPQKCTGVRLHVHEETTHRRTVTPLPHRDHNETLLPRLDTTVTPLPLKDHTDTPLPHEDHNETLLPHSNTTVTPFPHKDHSETTLHHSNSSVTPHPPVLSLSVGLAVSVLLLGLGLFILLRHRNRTKHAPVAASSSNRMNTDTGNTGGDNRVYEEVMELNQQPDADAAVTTIDSSFSLQEQPPESLYYTSISFTNNSLHPSGTALTADSTEYSTVQFLSPPPESGLYCTVTHPNLSVSNT